MKVLDLNIKKFSTDHLCGNIHCKKDAANKIEFLLEVQSFFRVNNIIYLCNECADNFSKTSQKEINQTGGI